RAVDELVRRANTAGGRDNVTVVVVDVIDEGDKARQASAALAGSAGATSTAPPIRTTEQAEAPRGRHAPRRVADERRRRLVTWRSVLFSVALLIVVGAIVGSVWWFARGTFYVGFDHDRVAIFRGRPGGVLWLDPTVEERTGIKRSDVEPARIEDLKACKADPTLP